MHENHNICHNYYGFPCSLGWWFVSVGAEEGWAPCSYLERLNGKEEEETISSLGKQLGNSCGM